MRKKTLFTEFDYDFTLIGISSHSKDYKLCFDINKALNTGLCKEKDVIFQKKKDEVAFSMYFFQDEIFEKDIRLIANKKNGRILISEQKMADFFLILYDFNTFEIKEVQEKLTNINVILTSFLVDVSTLKSKQNLIF